MAVEARAQKAYEAFRQDLFRQHQIGLKEAIGVSLESTNGGYLMANVPMVPAGWSKLDEGTKAAWKAAMR